MAETRVIERVDRACFLPKTPEKKAQVAERIISGKSENTKHSCRSKGILKTPKERRVRTTPLRALAADISDGLSQVRKWLE